MPIQTVTKQDSFRTWIEKTNVIPEPIGELSNLNTTDQTSLVNAINELVDNNAQMLFGWFDDKSPQLYDDLDINGNDIIGVGNIDINGYMDSPLTTGVTGVSQGQGDSSTKIATTEFTDLKVATNVPNAAFGGDVSGFSPNIQIMGNTVDGPKLENYVNNSLVGTDGVGNLDFINISGGTDLTGNIWELEIADNAVGLNELNGNDTSAGHVMATEGGVQQFTFKPVVTLSTITPIIGDQTFNIDYSVGRILVYLNGIKLVNGHDFTANNGTSVSLTNAVSTANSTIDFQRFIV